MNLYPQIVSIGELLIDLIALEKNTPLENVIKFQKLPGGAPANVSVAVSSLGVSSGLISKVGNDPFGDFLIQSIREKKVDANQIFRDSNHHTGVVFVESQEGVPKFMLYSDVAYNFLRAEEINPEYIKNAKLLNFGGVLLIQNPAREAVIHCISIAKDKIPVAFDINLRKDLLIRHPDLWEHIVKALPFVDILKISKDEVFDLYSHFNPQKTEPNLEQAFNYLIEAFNLKIIALTMGGSGSKIISIKNHKIQYEIFEKAFKVKVIDTVGAGDAFLGALLVSLLRLNKLENLEDINKEEIAEILKFCNKFAALKTTQVGAWNLPKIIL